MSRITRASTGRVIACIDDGPGGFAVARVAGFLADRLHAPLMLATVQPPAAPGIHVDPGLVGRGRRRIARVARELDRPAELRVAFGEPAERLVALAQRESAELVVIGAPGRVPMRPSLLGGAYLALAGAGPCPVVLVPRDMDTLPAPDGPIVCHVDGSPPSLAAARFATALSGRLNVELRLVSVTRTPPAAAYESAQLVVTGSYARDDGCLPSLPTSVLSRLAAAAPRPLVIVPCRPVPERLGFATHRLRTGAVLCVRGEIDMATAPELELEATDLLASSDGRLILDLSETTFMDVVGFRATERIARRAAELGGRLVVIATAWPVRRILELVPHPWLVETADLDAAFEAVDNRSTAWTEPLPPMLDGRARRQR